MNPCISLVLLHDLVNDELGEFKSSKPLVFLIEFPLISYCREMKLTMLFLLEIVLFVPTFSNFVFSTQFVDKRVIKSCFMLLHMSFNCCTVNNSRTVHLWFVSCCMNGV